jgi:hypothetical protein
MAEMIEQEEDLNRPVTLREFRQELGKLIERFDKLDADRAEERKEREAEKMKAEAERAAAEEEDANLWRKWDEGKMVEFLQLYFRVHKGKDFNRENDFLITAYHRVKAE